MNKQKIAAVSVKRALYLERCAIKVSLKLPKNVLFGFFFSVVVIVGVRPRIIAGGRWLEVEGVARDGENQGGKGESREIRRKRRK